MYKILNKRLRKIDISGQFSFSGTKAQVHSLLEYFKREDVDLDDKLIAQVAWMFQERTTDALVAKLSLLIDQYDPTTIGIV
jgi:tRNA A37 threonylcarbamoyltransferase TsaD